MLSDSRHAGRSCHTVIQFCFVLASYLLVLCRPDSWWLVNISFDKYDGQVIAVDWCRFYNKGFPD